MDFDDKQVGKMITFSVIIILLVLSYLVVKPLLIAILVGLIIAFVFYPLYKIFLKWTKSPNLSATLVCAILFLMIIIPVWFLLPIAVKQIFDIYLIIQNLDISHIGKEIFPSLFSSPEFSSTISSNINGLTTKLTSWIIAGFTNYLLESPTILLNVFIFIFVFFFGLRDGEKLLKYLKEISPFSEEYEQMIFNKFAEITNSVIFGHVIAGAVQGITAGIGFLIFGVPNVIVLTLFAIILAMIPMLGAYFVWVPAGIYLLSTGNTVAGIGLLIWGVTLVSWIDNVIRTLVINRKTKINSSIIVVSMIGGMIAFGFFGIMIGPLVISYLLLLIELYKQKKLKI